MSEVDQQVIEVLKNFGSREKFIGVIDHYDLAGTTAYIRSDKVYLAFASEMLGLKPGQLVSFRKDGSWRAKDIVAIEPEESHGI